MGLYFCVPSFVSFFLLPGFQRALVQAHAEGISYSAQRVASLRKRLREVSSCRGRSPLLFGAQARGAMALLPMVCEWRSVGL